MQTNNSTSTTAADPSVDSDAGGLTVRKCAAQHFGPWMVYHQWFSQAVQAVKEGTFKADAAPASGQPASGGQGYRVVGDGLAIVGIYGQITKEDSSFGGANSVRVRRAMRAAAADGSVNAILLHIDSPGGTVAGTGDLADDVARIDEEQKPVFTYFEDLGASAAYWIGAQGRKIFANPTAMVGSIGTMTYVQDTSGAYEKAGIKVTLIATGKYKGQWIDGNPVSEEYIAEVRREVEALNEHFLSGVEQGRGMSREQLLGVADGRVFIASEAQKLGLIDEVASLDAAMQAITDEVSRMNAQQFSAYAAEHSEADEVKALRAQGHKAGVAQGSGDERTRVLGIFEAHGLKDHPALASVRAGHDVETAKVVADAAAKSRAEVDAQLKAKDEEIARLKAAAGGQPALALAVAVPTDAQNTGKTDEEKSAADSTDPAEAQAKSEWSKLSAEQKGTWISEAIFIKTRIRQITRGH